MVANLYVHCLLTGLSTKVPDKIQPLNLQKSIKFCLFSIKSVDICGSAKVPGPKMNGPIISCSEICLP